MLAVNNLPIAKDVIAETANNLKEVMIGIYVPILVLVQQDGLLLFLTLVVLEVQFE